MSVLRMLFFSITVISPIEISRSQGGPAQQKELERIVVAAKPDSHSEITVPPSTSISFNLKNDQHSEGANALEFSNWIKRVSALNGLESEDLRPWHIVIRYEQYDEDGDNVDSGVFEEFWAGPSRYKRIYKGPSFNQTDYATSQGLFRLGDQRWPKPAELEVRAEVVAPFSYAAALPDVQARDWERTFGNHKLQCVAVEKDFRISDPTQYCFEPDTSVLRYTRGEYWHQIVYNRIESFQGRNIAREVDVTDGGKRYLELRVETLEPTSQVKEADFVPPPDAMAIGDRVSGVRPIQISMAYPQWPASMRGQKFAVTVEFLIGKDGRVVSAHGITGPPEGYKPCEDAVRKWVFRPYLVLDKPVEVQQKTSCSVN